MSYKEQKLRTGCVTENFSCAKSGSKASCVLVINGKRIRLQLIHRSRMGELISAFLHHDVILSGVINFDVRVQILLSKFL
jgi:hypothetical protein